LLAKIFNLHLYILGSFSIFFLFCHLQLPCYSINCSTNGKIFCSSSTSGKIFLLKSKVKNSCVFRTELWLPFSPYENDLCIDSQPDNAKGGRGTCQNFLYLGSSQKMNFTQKNTRISKHAPKNTCWKNEPPPQNILPHKISNAQFWFKISKT